MLTIYRLFFFFNDTATTEIYTLSLHDALPILRGSERLHRRLLANRHLGPYITNIKDKRGLPLRAKVYTLALRSEEHTSELQSRQYLVCRLLLEKKKKAIIYVRQPTTLCQSSHT